MAASSNIIGVTTTIEIKPDTANRIQNRIIRQKHQVARLTPNFILKGIIRIPMITPATSVRNIAVEYLANLTITKQMTRDRKMVVR